MDVLGRYTMSAYAELNYAHKARYELEQLMKKHSAKYDWG